VLRRTEYWIRKAVDERSFIQGAVGLAVPTDETTSLFAANPQMEAAGIAPAALFA
jgi:hypothetical protein